MHTIRRYSDVVTAQPAPRILLTGFGPFPGVADNPSGALACHLANSVEDADQSLTALVLPVDWRRTADALRAGLDYVSPDIVLMFGVSKKAEGFRIERFAYNGIQPRPDCDGFLPPRGQICSAHPHRLESALPAAKLARTLKAAGHTATVSRSAGRYLCNLSYLHALAWASESQPAPLVSFIHIPIPSIHTASFEEIAFGAARIVRFAAWHRRNHPSLPALSIMPACSTAARF